MDAQQRYTEEDTLAALEGKSSMVWRIAYCESKFDPYAYNLSSGATGVAQLLPGRGNGMSIFYSWGFQDPNNPWEAVAFIEEVIDRGMLASQYPQTRYGCKGSRW